MMCDCIFHKKRNLFEWLFDGFQKCAIKDSGICLNKDDYEACPYYNTKTTILKKLDNERKEFKSSKHTEELQWHR